MRFFSSLSSCASCSYSSRRGLTSSSSSSSTFSRRPRRRRRRRTNEKNAKTTTLISNDAKENDNDDNDNNNNNNSSSSSSNRRKEPDAIVSVKLDQDGQRDYPIYIGSELVKERGDLLRKHIKGETVLIVTNETVAPLYLEKVKESLLLSSS